MPLDNRDDEQAAWTSGVTTPRAIDAVAERIATAPGAP